MILISRLYPCSKTVPVLASSISMLFLRNVTRLASALQWVYSILKHDQASHSSTLSRLIESQGAWWNLRVSLALCSLQMISASLPCPQPLPELHCARVRMMQLLHMPHGLVQNMIRLHLDIPLELLLARQVFLPHSAMRPRPRPRPRTCPRPRPHPARLVQPGLTARRDRVAAEHLPHPFLELMPRHVRARISSQIRRHDLPQELLPSVRGEVRWRGRALHPADGVGHIRREGHFARCIRRGQCREAGIPLALVYREEPGKVDAAYQPAGQGQGADARLAQRETHAESGKTDEARYHTPMAA